MLRALLGAGGPRDLGVKGLWLLSRRDPHSTTIPMDSELDLAEAASGFPDRCKQ